MSELTAFLKQNKKEMGNVKIAASENFVNADGKIVEWEIRPLKTKEAENIRAQCTTSRKGERKIDAERFNRLIAAACTVYPDLDDTKLQDSYGVMGAENLIQEMLDVDGEYQSYIAKIMEISGYNQTMKELIDEAKN